MSWEMVNMILIILIIAVYIFVSIIRFVIEKMKLLVYRLLGVDLDKYYHQKRQKQMMKKLGEAIVEINTAGIYNYHNGT
jgi:hypothetical protein